MNCTSLKSNLNQLVCELLCVDNIDNTINILGIIAAYDLLYIIDFIELNCNISASQLFSKLQFTDMSVDGLTNTICNILGVNYDSQKNN